jgi:hypothetical protein
LSFVLSTYATSFIFSPDSNPGGSNNFIFLARHVVLLARFNALDAYIEDNEIPLVDSDRVSFVLS